MRYSYNQAVNVVYVNVVYVHKLYIPTNNNICHHGVTKRMLLDCFPSVLTIQANNVYGGLVSVS